MTCERAEATPAPAPPGAPTTITLRDIASFRPAKPGNEMEPGGWAVAGLPANFVADAPAEVVAGTLLGRRAEVRFTPVGFRWVHSDGTTVTSSTSGASWERLGLREFSPTETSHVYAEPGEYTVTLEVALAAEYRFGGSAWQAIAGTLAVAGEPQQVLVGEVDTVLTTDDCRANSAAPGC
ncbi:PKD domain-containing protein [Agromyces italicus]|uniref:PKD domain-containing protein n=1 Tax=Agromyces italicus TaxID=279572 RepID=UPI0003B5266B|nr:PKD domain-containing protein [Agromyces italicus]